MANEAFEDRLIHALLLEDLAGEVPPDLTRKIMRRAAAKPLRLRRWLFPAAAAAAAVIGLSWLLLRTAYPAPQLSGAIQVAGGGKPQRGAVLKTGNNSGSVTLGGYCQVTLAADSQITLEGQEHAEQIYLTKGKVSCDIEKKQGAFVVRTDVGTVSVVGTKFTVRLIARKGEEEMGKRKIAWALAVAVAAGSVNVEYGGKLETLSVGPEKVYGANGGSRDLRGFSGQVRGVVIKVKKGKFKFKVFRVIQVWEGNKARNAETLVGKSVWVGPRREDHKRGRGKAVKLHLAFIRKLKPEQEITLEIYNPRGSEFHLLELSKEQRAEAHGEGKEKEDEEKEREKEKDEKGSKLPKKLRGFSGQVRGVVVAKGEKNSFKFKVARVLRVWKNNEARKPKALVGRTVRVIAGWFKHQHGKWRQSELHLAFIKKLEAGQELTLEIRNAEGPYNFQILELSKEQRAEAKGENGEREEREKAPEKKSGTVIGILLNKDKHGHWIEVKLDGQGEVRRFKPHWRGGAPKDGGGLDKEMVAAIKKLIVTNRVRVKWRWEELYRVEAVEVLRPEAKAGAVAGKITARGKHWIEVKPDGDGPVERYLPRWIGGHPRDGGGLDKEVVHALHKLRLGDRVELRWIYDERLRVVAVEKLGGREREEERPRKDKEKDRDLAQELDDAF